jgi:TPR repeat protein
MSRRSATNARLLPLVAGGGIAVAWFLWGGVHDSPVPLRVYEPAPLYAESDIAASAPLLEAQEAAPDATPVPAVDDVDDRSFRDAAEQGARLFADRKFAAAARSLQGAAETGYPRAQYQLGFLFYHGFGVEKDVDRAAYWFRRAAEQGDLDGQNMLGTSYREGRGVEQDYDEALRWYHSAAEQGLWDAHYNLGFMYQQGYGVLKDMLAAASWYRRAAVQGHAMAQLALARLYEAGDGLTQDLNSAKAWYTRAAAQDNEYAQLALKRLLAAEQ